MPHDSIIRPLCLILLFGTLSTAKGNPTFKDFAIRENRIEALSAIERIWNAHSKDDFIIDKDGARTSSDGFALAFLSSLLVDIPNETNIVVFLERAIPKLRETDPLAFKHIITEGFVGFHDFGSIRYRNNRVEVIPMRGDAVPDSNTPEGRLLLSAFNLFSQKKYLKEFQETNTNAGIISSLHSFMPHARELEIGCLSSGIPIMEREEKLRLARYEKPDEICVVALGLLAQDANDDIRLAAALNLHTPSFAVRDLTTDRNDKVRIAASNNLWHARTRQFPIPETPSILVYNQLPEIRRAMFEPQNEQLHSTKAVHAQTYRDCREAKSDLPRLFEQWTEHPYAVHAAVTNAVRQVAALRKRGAPLSDVRAFFEECALESFRLPIPTNHTVEQQKSTFMFRASLIQDEVFSMKNRDGFSATFAPKLADLCAHFKARRDAFDKRISAWKAAEPPLDGTPESQRRHEDWGERGNLLRAHRDWAECERRTIHLWLFDYFTDNWTSDGLSNLSPKARYDARIALLRRANVDSGPFQSLSDEAMQCFRRETNARERELAADEKRRAWLWSRAKGSLGSGFPGRIESYEVDPPLKEHLNRFRLMAGRFVRNPVEGAGRELTTDSISNSIPFLLFTPKVSASKAMPVILYFGGTGELGSDLSVQFRQSAVFRTICSDEFQKRHPCYLFAPLCPEGSSSLGPTQHGRGDDLGDLVFDALYALAANAKPTMDLNRLYITGLSWGGHAAFHMPWAYPGRFAAGIPVSAAPTAHMVTTNAPCSFWALYNEGEPHRTAIEERMRKTKEIVEAHGGELRWSTFPDAGHDAWTKAWAEPAVWDWCFSKTADGRPVPGARTQATTAEAISAQTPLLTATRPGTPGHEPERASDGLAATWYEGDGPAKTGDVLESELPEPRSGRLRVELRGTEAERPRCHVETSADGRIWTRVGTISRKTGAFAATLTTPVVRVRIVVDTPAPHPLRVTTLLVEQRP